MALPTLEKTWATDFNTLHTGFASVLEMHQTILLDLHTKVIGYAAVPWTVVSSSDSVTASAANNWSVVGDLVWVNTPGTAHSWMVWERTGGEQICVDCVGDTVGAEAVWLVSPGGNFTGGTTTNRPTATDELEMISINNDWWHNRTSISTSRMHTWHTSDGAVDIIAAGFNGICTQLFMFLNVVLDEPGWTNPFIAGASTNASATTNAFTFTQFFADDIRLRGVDNSNNEFQGRFLTVSFDNTPTNQVLAVQGVPDANVFHAGRPMTPIWFGSAQGAGYGIHGRLPDMFAGSANLNNGDEETGMNWVFVEEGLWLPGDGATTLLWT